MEISPDGAAGEFYGVIFRLAGDVFLLQSGGMVGMDVVKIRGAGKGAEEVARCLAGGDLVPAHVGDFFHRGGEADDGAFQYAEALDSGAFFARIEEELVPEADAEKGEVGLDPVAEGGDEVSFTQVGHGVTKGSDAGKDDGGGGKGVPFFGRVDSQDGSADSFEGFFHAAEVAPSVVDHAKVHEFSLRQGAVGSIPRDESPFPDEGKWFAYPSEGVLQPNADVGGENGQETEPQDDGNRGSMRMKNENFQFQIGHEGAQHSGDDEKHKSLIGMVEGKFRTTSQGEGDEAQEGKIRQGGNRAVSLDVAWFTCHRIFIHTVGMKAFPPSK